MQTIAVKKDRDIFWQAVRGICMLLVIMIHCPSANAYPVNSPEFITWMLLRQLIDLPVAVFFFLSGYFVNQEQAISNPKAYLLKRTGILLIPYLLWSVLYMAISILRNLIHGNVIAWSHYALNFVTGGAAAPFYYIVCLLQLTLLTPWILKLLRKDGRVKNLIWFITPVYLFAIYLCQIFAPDFDFIISNKGLFFPAWILFYCFGIYAKEGKLNILTEKFGKGKYVAIALMLEIIEAAIIVTVGLGGTFASSQLKFSSFLYAGLICLWLLNLFKKENTAKRSEKKSILLEGLRYVGDRSYGLFYIHCMILMFVNVGIRILGIEELWLLRFLVCYISTTVISIIAINITYIIAKKLRIEKALKWIGF